VVDPYYADDHVTLYLGDCLEQLAWLDADVLITDPPYGIAYEGGASGSVNFGKRIHGDTTVDARDDVLDLWGQDRYWAMFGSWKAPRPLGTRQVLVWDKSNAGPGMGYSETAFGLSHEEIYLGGPSAWPRRGLKRLPSVFKTHDNQRPSSVTGLVRRIGHPTPKPVGMMEQLVRYTEGVVADPFAGSGSTLLAARNLGRRVIGVELVEEYAELAAGRLSQLTLLEGV
jgi:site-specific DNA-methyltransferase (adenine-specific)